MNLTVHIGTTKTGTSSIQRFLHNNRTALRTEGIHVPSTLGNVIHYYAAVASLPYGLSPDLARAVPVADREAYTEFVQETVAKFRQGVESARMDGCDQCIISAEQLQSRLTHVDHVKSFSDRFAQGFRKIRIIVYVRPQLDQAVSLYSTVLRTGYSESLTKFLEARMRPKFRTYFDLRDVIQRWAAVFGETNIVVRPHKGIPGETGVVGDFLRVLGIELSEDGWKLGGRANPSINAAGQDLLRMLNEGGRLDAAERRKVVSWVEENCAGPGEEAPLSLAREFQALFDESNAWVTQTFFPGHPEYLEPRWPSA